MLPEVIDLLPAEVCVVYAPLLAPAWTPERPAPPNGSAMGALAQAVWAVRIRPTFESAVTAVVDLGGDTDSAGAVTGTLAGAVHGLGAIPSRWVTYVHGWVTGPDGRRCYDHLDLQSLGRRLLGGTVAPGVDGGAALSPTETG